MTAVEQQDPPRRTRMPAAERRESILAAATAVFAESGYQAAKVADIAARGRGQRAGGVPELRFQACAVRRCP